MGQNLEKDYEDNINNTSMNQTTMNSTIQNNQNTQSYQNNQGRNKSSIGNRSTATGPGGFVVPAALAQRAPSVVRHPA